MQSPLLPQPLVVADHLVTVWQYIHGVAPGPQWARAHGDVLRRAHDSVAVEPGDNRIDQLSSARTRVSILAERQHPHVGALMALIDHATVILGALEVGESVAAHGDYHRNNAVLSAGRLHIIDFDAAGVGPRLLDVAAALRWWRRDFPASDAADDFLAGYGSHPVLDCTALEVFVWVKALRAACTRAYNGSNISERLQTLAATAPT